MVSEKIKVSHGEVLRLEDSIKKPTIVCGFNGQGVAGAIVTTQFMEDMQFREIGSTQLKNVPPILVIKDKRILKPVSVLYNKKSNIIVIMVLAPPGGNEWQIADLIEKVYEKLDAKELIVVDGFVSSKKDKVFYAANFKKKFDKYAKRISDSVITGVTSALLLKGNISTLCLLGNNPQASLSGGEAKISVAPTAAAINVINVLNSYLGIKLNVKSLEEKGTKIENELQDFTKKLVEARADTAASYIG